MNILKAYAYGFKSALQFIPMILLVYLFNIILALFFALPFIETVDYGFQKSALASELVNNFDYTIITDFYKNKGELFIPLLKQIKWFLVMQFFLSVFLTGGIVRTINKTSFTMNAFFGGAGVNFFRFSRLGIYMLILHVLIAGTIYFTAGNIISNMFETFESELGIYNIILIAGAIHLFFLILLFAVSDYAKFYLILNNSYNALKSILKGFQFSLKHFFSVYFLYLILLIAPIAAFYLYWNIDADITMVTTKGFIIMFIAQQLFVISRFFFKTWILSSELELYGSFFIKDEKIRTEKERILEWESQVKPIPLDDVEVNNEDLPNETELQNSSKIKEDTNTTHEKLEELPEKTNKDIQDEQPEDPKEQNKDSTTSETTNNKSNTEKKEPTEKTTQEEFELIKDEDGKRKKGKKGDEWEFV